MLLPDTQEQKDLRGLYLPKVGIRRFELPLQVTCEKGTVQMVPAIVSAYTDLNASVKGINMSRIAEILLQVFEGGLSFKEEKSEIFIQIILQDLVQRLKSQDSYVKVKFPLFFKKAAPKSGKAGFIKYTCTLEGIFHHEEPRSYRYYMAVRVPYISCCSCSKALSEHLEQNHSKGAPHNQRSYADVKIELDYSHPLGIRKFIKTIEDAVYTLPYQVIKRVDEQEIAKRSWSYTQFVEDSSRNIGLTLKKLDLIKDWVVVVNHEESIHQHNASAILYKGVKGGLR